MPDIRLESQFRSGTHYMLSSLAVAYNLAPMIIGAQGEFHAANSARLKLGLGDIEPELASGETDGCVFSYHFYHAIAPSRRLKNAKTIYLIGYPFDAYLSSGLVYASEKYTVAPSLTNSIYNEFRLEGNSTIFEQCAAYFETNAHWLQMLAQDDAAFILRYEDLCQDVFGAKKRVETHIGAPCSDFLPLKSNTNRTYLSDAYLQRMDKTAFDALYDTFKEPIRALYPEKIQHLETLR